MRKFFKRIFCFHSWTQGRPFGDFIGEPFWEWMGYEPYHCGKCGKLKYFPPGRPPIIYVSKRRGSHEN